MAARVIEAIALRAVWLSATLMLAPADDPTAMDRLAAAALARERGELELALTEVDAAVAADPELPFAYLARAQIHLELAGDPARAPADPLAARRWAAHLQAAADDLDRHLAHGDVDAQTRDELEQQRDALRIIAERELDRSHVPTRTAMLPTTTPPAPRTQPMDRPSPPTRSRAGVALLASGWIVTAGAVGLATASLRIEQRCRDLCDARWSTRPAFLAPAVIAAIVGAGIAGSGTWLAAKRDRARARHWRIAGGVLVGLGAVALASVATTTALTRHRWRTVAPDDDAGLARAQIGANATVAVATAVPTLLGTGLLSLLGSRRSR